MLFVFHFSLLLLFAKSYPSFPSSFHFHSILSPPSPTPLLSSLPPSLLCVWQLFLQSIFLWMSFLSELRLFAPCPRSWSDLQLGSSFSPLLPSYLNIFLSFDFRLFFVSSSFQCQHFPFKVSYLFFPTHLPMDILLYLAIFSNERRSKPLFLLFLWIMSTIFIIHRLNSNWQTSLTSTSTRFSDFWIPKHSLTPWLLGNARDNRDRSVKTSTNFLPWWNLKCAKKATNRRK